MTPLKENFAFICFLDIFVVFLSLPEHIRIESKNFTNNIQFSQILIGVAL